MRPSNHILVVNGVKVRRPVFVLGAPASGTALLARALKRSAEFHVTMGQPGVLRVAYAFARRPSLAHGRPEAAARVLRDAFADAWRITPAGCSECSAECRRAAEIRTGETCVRDTEVSRFGDASHDLIYTGTLLLDAFPDAQLVQVIRDGRDVAAAMLADEQWLAWFKPSVVNLDEEFPNPFLGVENEADRAAWKERSLAAKCAMRWRSCVRLSARMRSRLPKDQLLTVRYERLATEPGEVGDQLAEYLAARVYLAGTIEDHADTVGTWRKRLTPGQLADVEEVAGEELGALGYDPVAPADR
ncbi:MAG: sulfotransferase [Streptosporangiales bacterium]|nr:sulfotransferase [Streptosporangiales bacterium]